jgi:uncharacterized protein (TIGR00304 family)
MVDIGLVGVLLILGGLVTIVAGIMLSSNTEERHVRGGGVVLVGPIPVAFGSDARWTSIAIVLAIVLVLTVLLLHVV